MTKTLLLASIATCLCALNANATEIRPYAEGRLSQSWMEAETKVGNLKESFKDNEPSGSLEIGAKIGQFRVGLEGFYNHNLKDKFLDIVPVKGETKGAFLNAYYDIPLCNLKQVKPYVGAGIGRSWLKETVDMVGFSAKDRKTSWNAGFGVAYELGRNTDLALGYRYEDLGRIKSFGSKTDFTNHKVYLGLRYTF